MLKFLPLCLIMVCSMFITESCNRRDLIYDNAIDHANIEININWNASKLSPEYATLLFYKEGAKEPITHYMTTTTGVVRLPEGKYSIIVFNEKPGDFDVIDFRGTESYKSIQAFSKPSIKGYQHVKGSVPIQSTEMLAVSTMEEFVVTKEMIDNTLSKMLQQSGNLQKSDNLLKSTVATLAFEPKAVTINTKVVVHIKGINNIRQETSRGSLDGFAESIYLHSGKVTTIPGVCYFDLTTFTLDEGSTTSGKVSGRINIFGFCDNGDGNNQELIFSYNALLRDAEHTPYSVVRNVTKLVNQKPDTSVELVINVGTNTETNPDNPIIIVPDVKPEDSGFVPSIPDWGDVEVIDKIL